MAAQSELCHGAVVAAGAGAAAPQLWVTHGGTAVPRLALWLAPWLAPRLRSGPKSPKQTKTNGEDNGGVTRWPGAPGRAPPPSSRKKKKRFAAPAKSREMRSRGRAQRGHNKLLKKGV